MKIREVEIRIEFTTRNATVVGEGDVILHDGYKSVEVCDYKTPNTSTTPDEVALQLRLYSLDISSFGEKVTRGLVVYLEN